MATRDAIACDTLPGIPAQSGANQAGAAAEQAVIRKTYQLFHN